MPTKKAPAKAAKTKSTVDSGTFAIGSLRVHKRRLLRVLAMASLVLNLLFVLGIGIFFHEIANAPSSRYANAILGRAYQVQDEFCVGDGYNRLLALASKNSPTQDAERAKTVAAENVCHIDYKTGKYIDDSATKAAQDTRQQF